MILKTATCTVCKTELHLVLIPGTRGMKRIWMHREIPLGTIHAPKVEQSPAVDSI